MLTGTASGISPKSAAGPPTDFTRHAGISQCNKITLLPFTYSTFILRVSY